MLHTCLAAALLAPTLALPLPQEADQPSAQDQPLFPAARIELRIPPPENDEWDRMSILDLIREYEEITQQVALLDEDTYGLARQRRVQASTGMVVEPEDAQYVFESLLIASDFVLTAPGSLEKPMFKVASLQSQGRSSLRSGATTIPASRLDEARRHPAVLFTTTIELPHVDVRQLSNTLRTMVVDANTQQILPAGTTQSMVLVGFGDWIASMADRLRAIDDAAAAEEEAHTTRIEVIQLEHAVAKEVVEICEVIYGRIEVREDQTVLRPGSILVLEDRRTNSLVVRGTDAEHARVAQLVAQLDRPAPERKK